MCGFIVAASRSQPEASFVRRRGPDHEGRHRAGGFEFVHFLLHVTGERLHQPFVDDDVVCVFNGEIYGRAFDRSDGELLIPLYRQHGVTFARHLDGEYAIALYDFGRERALFATDPFGTKPLWVDGAECASYPSVLGGRRAPPNTTLVKTLTGQTIARFANHDFDFERQDKEDFSDWIAAFRRAVRKRATSGCYVGLSSGYDSGAIACELHRQRVNFQTYSILGDENLLVLQERHRLVGGRLLPVTAADYAHERQFLETSCEKYNYHRETGLRLRWAEMLDDPGAVGASLVHRAAVGDGRRVFLSGQGADETLSDYALTPTLSHFHGVFPERLEPWPNLFGGCQLAYLTKEEFVAGSHGVEGRYPFLDASLVQEFLWLAPHLKNSAYKAPLRHYLQAEAFPFAENRKVGFGVDFDNDSPAESH